MQKPASSEAAHRFGLRKPIPLYGVLDNIRSLHNVGSIFRTSDGAGVAKLYLCGITGRPPRPEIRKTALGSEDSVPWEYHPKTTDAIGALRSQGVSIVVLERTEKSIRHFDAAYPFPCALVVGHEFFGVSAEVMALADLAVEIPMAGIKGSLNVAVAYGIVVYEIARQWCQHHP